MLHFDYPETVNLRGYKPSTEGNAKQIKKVAETIYEAERPILCLGGGVLSADARDLVKQLSEESGIPVVTTMMGLGALSSEHPMNLGMIGSYGHFTANKALNETDLLIIIGARVGDRAFTSSWNVNKKTKTIHIDIDPAEIGKNVSTTIPLVGDIKLVVSKLLEENPKSNCNPWSDMLCQAAALEKSKIFSLKEAAIDPKRLMHELGIQIQNDAIIVADVGQNQIWAAKYLPVKNGRFLTSGGLGTMGYSLPAAIGAKVADPDKQIIVICGDGGFQMVFNELSTMVENGLDLKIVLINNRSLGLVCELQKIECYKNFCVELPANPDFQILASAFGLSSKCIVADEDMHESIEEMLSHKGPFLLECVVSPDEKTKIVEEVN
jgi:acetolactate synthase-1/2/3 large subunit